MGLFSTGCSNCGSIEHATVDCPHSGFSSKCANCGSIEHATADCPHSGFSSKCSSCGSTEHSTSDCPHSGFSSKCASCGSVDHATSDCPHSGFSTKCGSCGSKNHSTANCPHSMLGGSKTTSYDTSSGSTSGDNSGCTTAILWLVGIGVSIFVAIWLAVYVVLPVTLLNSALAFTVLTFTFKRFKTLFAALALVGGGYMIFDITNGWLSSIFVNEVVKNPVWISAFVYLNSVAVGLSVWFLVQPIWTKAQQIRTTEKRKSILLKIATILLVAIGTLVAPAMYNTIQNRFTKKIQLPFNIKEITGEKQYSVSELIPEMANNLQNEDAPPPPPPGEPGGPFIKKSADNLTLLVTCYRNQDYVNNNLKVIIENDGRVFLNMENGMGNGRDTISHFRPSILEQMGKKYNITFSPIELRKFEIYDSSFGVSIHDIKRFFAINDNNERQKVEKGIPCDIADNQLLYWLVYAWQTCGNIKIHIDTNEAPQLTIKKVKHSLDELCNAISEKKNSSQEEVAVEQQDNKVFVVVEEMPEFPGGEVALRQYIANAISYPDIAKKNRIQGKVFVNFVVEKDGSVSNAKIARGVDPALDAEALRIISTLPKWKSGKQKGAIVRVSYTVPVNFKLE